METGIFAGTGIKNSIPRFECGALKTDEARPAAGAELPLDAVITAVKSPRAGARGATAAS